VGALVVTQIFLTALTGDLRQSFSGVLYVVVATFAAVGFVITRRAGTPIAVLDFHDHAGVWPLGHVAIIGQPSWTLGMVFVGLAVALFPDGVAPSHRWRTTLWFYLAFGLWFYGAYTVGQIMLHVTPDTPIDGTGAYSGPADTLDNAAWLVSPVLVGFWIAFVVRQASAWRAAAGERREQLKWLMSCGAVTVASIVCVVFTNGTGHLQLLTDVAALGIAALPVGIGVGILKYRLYEIDRLVSRTISYLLLTGLLVALFAGIVVLATDVLPFSSPVGVAASTLAAAALFNPLRRRLQHLVDRRFNRARYDAEATLDAFARQLRQAVEPEAVETSLLEALRAAVEPAHVTLWLRETR
jgi:hypothetical protein